MNKELIVKELIWPIVEFIGPVGNSFPVEGKEYCVVQCDTLVVLETDENEFKVCVVHNGCNYEVAIYNGNLLANQGQVAGILTGWWQVGGFIQTVEE